MRRELRSLAAGATAVRAGRLAIRTAPGTAHATAGRQADRLDQPRDPPAKVPRAHRPVKEPPPRPRADHRAVSLRKADRAPWVAARGRVLLRPQRPPLRQAGSGPQAQPVPVAVRPAPLAVRPRARPFGTIAARATCARTTSACPKARAVARRALRAAGTRRAPAQLRAAARHPGAVIARHAVRIPIAAVTTFREKTFSTTPASIFPEKVDPPTACRLAPAPPPVHVVGSRARRQARSAGLSRMFRAQAWAAATQALERVEEAQARVEVQEERPRARLGAVPPGKSSVAAPASIFNRTSTTAAPAGTPVRTQELPAAADAAYSNWPGAKRMPRSSVSTARSCIGSPAWTVARS